MKKAIVVVSFGSTVDKARTENIMPVIEMIRQRYDSYDVFEAFTSRIVVKRLRDRGLSFKTEAEVIQELIAAGYTDITIQSLHLIGGEEFNKLRQNVKELVSGHSGLTITFGRPLLFFTGQEGEYPDDFKRLLEALDKEVRPETDEEGVLFVSHGGVSPENTAFSTLQLMALQGGYDYMRMASLECYPTLDDIALPWLLGKKPKKVHIYPLLLVAGDHVLNDIMGDEKDSVVNRMKAAGYEVSGYPIGLGARKAIQELYVEHLEDALEQRYHYKKFFTI